MKKVRFLDDEWILLANHALGRIPPDAVGDGHFVLETVVRDGERTWRHQLVAAGRRLRLQRSGSMPADVVITHDRTTAERLARGELSAQHALLSGEMTIEGDVRKLVEISGVLEAAARALQPLRETTEF